VTGDFKVVGRLCKCQKVGYARVSIVSAEKVKDTFERLNFPMGLEKYGGNGKELAV